LEKSNDFSVSLGKVRAGIARRESLSWVWHLVQVSHGFEKSNDFSGKKNNGENCRARKQKFYKKSTFFHKFSFKTQFSLDNKDVRKICHAEFISASILKDSESSSK